MPHIDELLGVSTFAAAAMLAAIALQPVTGTPHAQVAIDTSASVVASTPECIDTAQSGV